MSDSDSDCNQSSHSSNREFDGTVMVSSVPSSTGRCLFLGSALSSCTFLRVLSFHHNCTAPVASHSDNFGPVVAMRSKLSNRFSPSHARLSVLISFS